MLSNFYTKRLYCRKINEKDVALITKWNKSAVSNGKYLTIEDAQVSLNMEKFKNNAYWNDKNKTYLIELKLNATPIGIIKYWTKINDPLCALVTLKIAEPKFRNQGYGTEVQKALVRELFKKYKYKSIEMHTDINNLAQQACLTKLDFENIESESYEDAGILRQGYLFRLTREKYERSGVHIYYYE